MGAEMASALQKDVVAFPGVGDFSASMRLLLKSDKIFHNKKVQSHFLFTVYALSLSPGFSIAQAILTLSM